MRRPMLKHGLLAGMVIALGASTGSSSGFAQRGAPAPGPCRMGTGGILDARLSANSLEDVIEAATLIVDAIVQTTEPIPGRQGYDQVLLIAASVLKGPSVQQFAMVQVNASNAFRMQPGERYILFL